MLGQTLPTSLGWRLVDHATPTQVSKYLFMTLCRRISVKILLRLVGAVPKNLGEVACMLDGVSSRSVVVVSVYPCFLYLFCRPWLI